MSSVLLICILSAMSCITPDNFGRKYARVVCQQGFECEAEPFDSYSDIGACREAVEASWEATARYADLFDCEVDYDLGGACLDEIQNASCDTFESSGWGDIGACYDMIICEPACDSEG